MGRRVSNCDQIYRKFIFNRNKQIWRVLGGKYLFKNSIYKNKDRHNKYVTMVTIPYNVIIKVITRAPKKSFSGIFRGEF